MNLIYEPKGAAREYAALACNPYSGCTHGCRYCYCPGILRKFRQEFHARAAPKPNVLRRLEASLAKRGPGGPRVLLSFVGDPYQPAEEELRLTRGALELFKRYDVPVSVLTKAGDLPRRDFDTHAS